MQRMMMLMLAGLVALCPSALVAQTVGGGTQKTQESKTAAPPETQIRVFRLKRAGCKNIAGLLDRMPLHVTAQYDLATGSVICMGTEENLRFCEELIGELDIVVEGAEPYVPDKTLVRVFRLKNASCNDVVRTINSLVTKKTRAEERTNSVIYVGLEYDLPVIEKIIQELDSIPTTAQLEPEREVIVVFVKHQPVNEVASQAGKSFPYMGRGEDNVSMSVDHRRSAILLRGSKKSVKKAEAVIRQLDTPVAMANLEFAFLKATSGDTQPDSDIPDDLKDVANELKRFGRIELLGRLVTMAVEGKPFNISGEKGGVFYRIMGKLLRASEDGAVKVEVEAKLFRYGERDPTTNKRLPHTVFDLETLVLTQRGDYVVLGSAPSVPGGGISKPGESAILVLHVPR